jgi:hypothetical protein
LSSNPYAAPKARVEDTAEARGQPAYFPVSRTKLILMSFGTFGIYQIYWFYKNWKAMQAEGIKLNAPVRAVFYPLTSYWLFRHIGARAAAAGVAGTYHAGGLAAALFIVSSVTWRLPDPWWLLGYAGFLLLLPVQASVDQINLKVAPDADRNARFSGWNIVSMIVGCLVLALAIVGMFVPQE